MTARVINGNAIAAQLLDGLARTAAHLLEHGVQPCLAFVMIGSTPPAQLYAASLEKLAARVDIRMVRRELPDDVTVSDLEAEIASLNADPATDGILVQMPLPHHLSPARLNMLIDPQKDVDGTTVENTGRLHLGLPGQKPSTASAVMHILEAAGVDVAGKHAVVIGRSTVVGRPTAELLLRKDATVTVTHTKTRHLESLTRQADILVAGAGKPGLVTADMISPGVVIVDAGTNVTDHGVVGDVDFVAAKEVAAAITPVPGGVGPVTNAILMQHVIDSSERRHG